MEDLELKNTDPEDIEDILLKVEKSFDIRFEGNELWGVKTFGQLCDHIANKIALENTNSCTTQQAFYKLREAISKTLNIDAKILNTDTTLKNIYPRDIRKNNIITLEKYLGFKLQILRPSHWLTGILLIILLISFGCLFLGNLYGLVGIFMSIVGFWIAKRTGIELKVETLGDLSKKMTRENYLNSRRNPKSFNKAEIEPLLRNWFKDVLYLDERNLSRNAKLN